MYILTNIYNKNYKIRTPKYTLWVRIPLPALILGGLYKIIKNEEKEDSSKRKTDLVYSRLISNQEEEKEEIANASYIEKLIL